MAEYDECVIDFFANGCIRGIGSRISRAEFLNHKPKNAVPAGCLPVFYVNVKTNQYMVSTVSDGESYKCKIVERSNPRLTLMNVITELDTRLETLRATEYEHIGYKNLLMKRLDETHA